MEFLDQNFQSEKKTETKWKLFRYLLFPEEVLSYLFPQKLQLKIF